MAYAVNHFKIVAFYTYRNHSTAKSSPRLETGTLMLEQSMRIRTIEALGTGGTARETTMVSNLETWT